MKVYVSILLAFVFSTTLIAQTKSLLIEDMSWTEVRDAIAAGKTTAIYYAGSIEQNGPGVALGKHFFIAHTLAQKIAEQLGNALVYPTMPFAPTGDWGYTISASSKTGNGNIDRDKIGGHMQMAGSVNVTDETFAAVAHDVAMSAITAGFRNVILIEDHGGGQQPLSKVAEAMNKEFGPAGIHVYYIPDLYYQEKVFMRDYLPKHGLAVDGHAGTDDTSEVMYVDKLINGNSSKWIRRDKLVKTEPNDTKGIMGVIGDQVSATPEMGQIFADEKVRLAVIQIKSLIAAGK
jgi:creatinine amidohydrolase/Fe(II)-dependent formamide hydrolase-like protein